MKKLIIISIFLFGYFHSSNACGPIPRPSPTPSPQATETPILGLQL